MHSYPADQNLLEGPHKDLRRAHSAAVNMIPTSGGAARAIDTVLPELAGRFDGSAVRVYHDVIGKPASCLFDSGLTRVVASLVKVLGWYDDERGYAHRTVDLLDLVARTLPMR